MSLLVEVRIPTYKRPDWLKNAINSLVAQTYSSWVALVFDDSPLQEAKTIVESFNDSRLIYKPNHQNLGASKNLNQCFDTKPYLNGNFAFVLEDDNWIYPDFIESNIKALEKYNVGIVHRNQDVWSRETAIPMKASHTTLGHRYYRERMSPMELHAQTFFFTGISNGALFFRTNIASQLAVADVEDPSIQEYMRCLAIQEDSVYLHEPKAAFAYVPIAMTNRYYDRSKLFSAFLQCSNQRLLDKYGKDLIVELSQIVKYFNYDRYFLHVQFANANRLPAKTYLKHPMLLISLIKGLIKKPLYAQKIRHIFS